ncbi:type VII secretion-associated serine protease mycosin [Mycolicibacterium sp. CBM1]
MTRRVVAVTAAALLMAAQCAPPAYAVAPPPIDSSRLPAPAPPSPPQPTGQQQPCAIPTHTAVGPGSARHTAPFDMTAIWRLSRGANQRVLVIDTGVAPHQRLVGVIGGGDYVSDGDGRQDCDGHGTVVAGIIAAAPDPSDPSGFAGIAPEATLVSIRQSSNMFGPLADPGSRGSGDVATLAMAVRTAADMGASVINISSVACTESTLDDRALGAALAYAVDVKDAVVVTAAGNVGGAGQCPRQNTAAEVTVVASPAWYDDYVLTVGSVAADGEPSPFSLTGPWVDVAAPGEDIVSLDPDGEGLIDTVPTPSGPVPISGTSYAAPFVSGLAALVRSRFPRLSARQVMARIETTAHHPSAGRDDATGHGVIDPLAALSDHSTPLAPPPPAPVVAASQSSPGTGHGHGVAAAATALCLAGVVAAGSARLRRRERDVAHD